MLSVLVFCVSATVVVVSASKMAQYGDVIAVRTKLGRLFIGTVLLSAATSLPELLTNIVAVKQNLPNLAAGNLMGSCIFNIVILALLDITHRNSQILRRIAMTHSLTGAFGIALLGLGALFILARLDIGLFGFGLDSLILLMVFFGGLFLVRRQGMVALPNGDCDGGNSTMSLSKALVLFALATGVLWVGATFLVRSSAETAELLGIGAGFFGASVLAIITSLPELIASIAAVRLGAYDMAVGNILGSNMFNIMTLAVIDGFYLHGYFLSDINSSFSLAAIIALLLTTIAIIGNLARVERRRWHVEVDAVAILVGYVLGMLLLFKAGISFG